MNVTYELNENISSTNFCSPSSNELWHIGFEKSEFCTSSPTPSHTADPRGCSARLQSPSHTNLQSLGGQLNDDMKKAQLPSHCRRSFQKLGIETPSSAYKTPSQETRCTAMENIQTETSSTQFQFQSIWKEGAMKMWQEEAINKKRKPFLVVSRTPTQSSQKKRVEDSDRQDTFVVPLPCSAKKLMRSDNSEYETPMRGIRQHTLNASEQSLMDKETLRLTLSAIPFKPISIKRPIKIRSEAKGIVNCTPIRFSNRNSASKVSALRAASPKAINTYRQSPRSTKSQKTGRCHSIANLRDTAIINGTTVRAVSQQTPTTCQTNSVLTSFRDSIPFRNLRDTAIINGTTVREVSQQTPTTCQTNSVLTSFRDPLTSIPFRIIRKEDTPIRGTPLRTCSQTDAKSTNEHTPLSTSRIAPINTYWSELIRKGEYDWNPSNRKLNPTPLPAAEFGAMTIATPIHSCLCSSYQKRKADLTGCKRSVKFDL